MSSDTDFKINRYVADTILGANASTTSAIAFGMTGAGFIPFLWVAALGAGVAIAMDKAFESMDNV